MRRNLVKLGRLGSVLLVTLLLSACVTTSPRGSAQPQFVQRAQSAIAANNWDGAYRALEDGFQYPDPSVQESSKALYRQFPNLRNAAITSFSSNNLLAAYNVYGEKVALPMIEKRLNQFEAVATAEEIGTARRNAAAALSGFKSGAKADLRDEAAIRRAKEVEEAQKAEMALKLKKQEEERQEIVALTAKSNEARRNAIFACPDKLSCDKAFALTQVFITTHSDMKIQMANDTIIQTYNPTETMAMGASAVKMPRSGTSAEIHLAIKCKTGGSMETLRICLRSSASIYEAFPTYMRANFIK